MGRYGGLVLGHFAILLNLAFGNAGAALGPLIPTWTALLPTTVLERGTGPSACFQSPWELASNDCGMPWRFERTTFPRFSIQEFPHNPCCCNHTSLDQSGELNVETETYLRFLIWTTWIIVEAAIAIAVLVISDFWCEKGVKVNFLKYFVKIEDNACVFSKTLDKSMKSNRAYVHSRCEWPTFVLVSSKLHVSTCSSSILQICSFAIWWFYGLVVCSSAVFTACCIQVWAILPVIACFPGSAEEERIISILFLISFLSCWILARSLFTTIDIIVIPILSPYGNVVAVLLTFHEVVQNVSLTIWIRITEDRELSDIIGASHVEGVVIPSCACLRKIDLQEVNPVGALQSVGLYGDTQEVSVWYPSKPCEPTTEDCSKVSSSLATAQHLKEQDLFVVSLKLVRSWLSSVTHRLPQQGLVAKCSASSAIAAKHHAVLVEIACDSQSAFSSHPQVIITSVPEIPLSQLCYAAWLLGDALCCDGDHVKTPVLQCIEYSCCAFEESQTDSSGSILVGYQVSAVTQDNKSDGQLVCDYWISTGVGTTLETYLGKETEDSSAAVSSEHSSLNYPITVSQDSTPISCFLVYTKASLESTRDVLLHFHSTLLLNNCDYSTPTEEAQPHPGYFRRIGLAEQESRRNAEHCSFTAINRCDNLPSRPERFCRPISLTDSVATSYSPARAANQRTYYEEKATTVNTASLESPVTPNGTQKSREVLDKTAPVQATESRHTYYHCTTLCEEFLSDPKSPDISPQYPKQDRPGPQSQVTDKRKSNEKVVNPGISQPVTSTTAPQPKGPRGDPVGREETEKVPVQSAPRSLQPVRPAQASDTGYSTGLSGKKSDILQEDDTTATAQLAVTEVATRSESSAEPTFAHASVAGAYKDEQYSMVHCSLTPQPNTVHVSELAIGKTKRVPPMLNVLKTCSDPKKYFDRDKFLESLQLESLLARMEVDTSLYITNTAKLEQMYPYLPRQERAVAEVVYSILKHAVSEEEEARAVRDTLRCSLRVGWNTLKDNQAIKYLNIDSIARKLLPPDAMAKWRKEKDNWWGIVEELRYFLKRKAERHLTRPRVVHALFVAAGDVQFINDVLLAGLFVSRDNPTLPEILEFLSGIQEPVVFDKVITEIVQYLKNAGELGLANELQEQGAMKSNPLHFFGLWLATAASTSRPSTWTDFVQLMKKGGVDEGVIQTIPGGPWGSHQGDVFHVTQQQPVTAAAVQELSTKQTDQPKVWNESTLESARNRNKDANEDVDGNLPEAKLGSRSSFANEDVDGNLPEAKLGNRSSFADQQSSDSSDNSKFYVGPPSSSNADPRNQRGVAASPSGSAAVQQPSQPPRANLPAVKTTAASQVTAASNAPRNRESEEEYYLSLPLDPSDVKSILYHAKAVYLTLDYTNARRILDILAHHLLIDEEMLRAKVFGYGICFYRQRSFPEAMEKLDELEKLALEHHSAGDVSLSCIYRGEIYMAQKKLDQAFRMFDHARATYEENTVATYYGIVIISKCSVMVKAANCQKQLMDYRKAKEVYQMAIEFAERVRHAKEALPQNVPERKNKVEAAYRDEITARCSLGNLFQNMSDCANALDQYEIVLDLQRKIEEDGAALGWAEGNYGNALLGLNRIKEAIPHLQKAFDLARRHEKMNQGISRAASNLGNAFQAAKQYDEAQNSFEIALGHSVFSGDEAGHGRALGNLGNVKLVKGEPLEALRCYNEALSLNCDETSRHTAYQNRASVYITLAAKVNEGVGEWDEVPEDIVAEEPREAISIQLPLEEQTREVESIHRQHMVLPSGKTLPRGGLDDSEKYFKEGKNGNPLPPLLPTGGGAVVPSAGGPLPSSSSTRLGTSHTHYLRHRKFYLHRAEEDLRRVVKFVEDRFAKVKGKEDTNSLALSIFEANSKAFYSLQKVLVCLGRSQEALLVAEANRARNLGEMMLSAKQSTTFSLTNVRVPLDLKSIWSFATSEQTPVAVLSCDVSCIMVHIIVPLDDRSAMVPLGGHGHQQTFTSTLMRGSKETIPANCYHFVKIELFTDTFTDEWSRNRNVRPTNDSITFERYVTKNLMDFLNEKETNLFETVDFEPRDNPLTVLFDQFARKFAEVIEATAPEHHELVVIADQALHLLPWPVLQDKASRKFLGDRYRVRTFPSILSMGVISSQPPPVITLPSEERFLVVGNPAIPKFINQKKEVTLGRLPHAEDEATQVSHILETTPLLREQATKQTVIYRLQMANIVHIATHGSGSQGYIALASNMPVLSNTRAVDAKECLLFIDEIQKLHINASLVVLSACDSARGEIVNEGVNSVARAILAAGAQSVLVSLVRVPDKSASIFMRLFYRFLAHDGMTTSEALQKSSMGVRCIKSLTQHVHWGGFQLIGRNIKIAYNDKCKSARVAALVGDPTPFPRLELLQQLERAIFRNDRTPPRDIVLVKGLSFYDPAEVVRDFVCKHFKHYPGGVFWYNASNEDLLDASVSFVKETMPDLKTIQREPVVEKIHATDKKRRNVLEGSGGESYDNHYRLIILDHPASLAACLKKIPEIHSSHSDIILIHTADTDRDQSLTRWVDEKLVRGCTPIVTGHLDKYDAIQRMAYSILRVSHITPYEEDYEAFDVLQQFCRGCSSLVRMLEGMLCREEPDTEVRQLASDIEQIQTMEPAMLARPERQDLPQTNPVAEKKGSFFRSKRHGKSKDRAKGEGRMRNGLISESQLTAEDHVQLSDGYEKPARLLSPIGTLMEMRMTQEEHFLLTALGYITLYPDAHSEGAFTFTDQFLFQLATVIATANGSTTEPRTLVRKLEELLVIRQYPLPVLSPPDYDCSFKLYYVPDCIVRAVTFHLDDSDIAFILTTCSTAVQHLSVPLSYHSALKNKVAVLCAEIGLSNLQQ